MYSNRGYNLKHKMEKFCIKVLKNDNKLGWWKKGSDTYPPMTQKLKSATEINSHQVAVNTLLRLSSLFTDYNFKIHKLKVIK